MKAISKDSQEEIPIIPEENFKRVQKIITDSRGLVHLPDFKHSSVVLLSEGTLLQTYLILYCSIFYKVKT